MRYKLSERNPQNTQTFAGIATTGELLFGGRSFTDWNQNLANGEPRDVIAEFNQTLSHVVVEDPGFGYSVPVQVQLIGGYPVGAELQQWYDENQTGIAGSRPLPYPFQPAIVEVNDTDPTTGEIIIHLVDPDLGTFAPN